ncbi:hypothetical protein D3C86_1487020 [compost metagenome]
MYGYRPETAVSCTFDIFSKLVLSEEAKVSFMIGIFLIGKPDILFTLQDITEDMVGHKSFPFYIGTGIAIQYYPGPHTWTLYAIS